jgi:hypothetical protein
MKKKVTRSIFVIFLLLLVISILHFIIFPQETRCMLIQFADFKKAGNIFFRPKTNTDTINLLKRIQSIAEKKVTVFWGNTNLLSYKIIYCNNENDYTDYGNTGTPATTQRKMGAYIILKAESLDTNILAHELSHAVMYNNLGWYQANFKIPKWFDEGLAMQVDDRDYYSIDTLLAKKNAGVILPDVKWLAKSENFYSGNKENIRLNFATSKYLVYEWLQTHSLQKFIALIKKEGNFEDAYSQ